MVFGDPEIVERGKWGSVTNARFQSTVFQRSPTAPATPSGGTYANPVPAGWSDGVPSGTAPVWMSSRWFGTGMGDTWSVPALMVDTQGTQTRWSEVPEDGDPGTPQSKPSAWSETATEDTVWMAVRTSSGGQWSAWQVVKVKGEKGDALSYSDFKAAGGLNDLAQSSALQSAVGDLLRGSSPYTIEFSPSVVAVVNKTGAAWSRTVTLIANRIAAMQSVAGGTWSVVSTEGTDVTASVTGNQLTVGGNASGGKVTVRFTGPDLATCERTLSVGVATVHDGKDGGKGDPGKDMTYADFVAGGGIGALAANTDLISGVKSDIDTSAFRADIGVRIKSGVKDLLAGDSAFKSALKPSVTFDKVSNKLLIDGVAASDSLKGGDGHSPTVTLGTDGYLVIDGTKQPTLLKGTDGRTPTIDPTTKKWKIGDTLTDVVAVGVNGTDGATFTPSVDASGNLSWSNNKGLTNPATKNIKGDPGTPGNDGKTFRPSWSNGVLTFTESTDHTSVSVSDIASKTYVSGLGYQTASDVDTLISGKGYLTQTAVDNRVKAIVPSWARATDKRDWRPRGGRALPKSRHTRPRRSASASPTAR